MKIKEYAEKYNEITRNFLERFAKVRDRSNIVISPMSIIILMGIAADATKDRARDEILDIIGGGSNFDEFIAILKGMQEISARSNSLMSSNAVCVKETISDSILSEYPSRLREIFEGELFTSSDIVHDVNAWVNEKTNGMIEKVDDKSMNQMVACIMNAITFESEWMKQYEEDNIYEGEFNNVDGTVVEVQMLDSIENVYIEDKFFTGFVKPYKDEDFAFMSLLPKDNASDMTRVLQKIDFTKLFNGTARRRYM